MTLDKNKHYYSHDQQANAFDHQASCIWSSRIMHLIIKNHASYNIMSAIGSLIVTYKRYALVSILISWDQLAMRGKKYLSVWASWNMVWGLSTCKTGLSKWKTGLSKLKTGLSCRKLVWASEKLVWAIGKPIWAIGKLFWASVKVV